MPVQGTESQSRFCLCCASRPIEARAWLDHLAYVPGQNIFFSAQVFNRSGGLMSGSQVKLVQVIRFCQSFGPSFEISNVVVSSTARSTPPRNQGLQSGRYANLNEDHLHFKRHGTGTPLPYRQSHHPICPSVTSSPSNIDLR